MLTPDLRVRAGFIVVIVGGMAALGTIVPWMSAPAAVVGFLVQSHIAGA